MKKTTVRIFVCVLFICLGCLQSYALAGMPIDDCENNERYANSYGGNVVLEISNKGIAKATARVNNPASVSLLSGDRKPQIRF